MTMKKTIIASSIIASIFAAPAALAFKEYPAGEPIKINDMEIAAVYLQPIDMEPRGMGLPAAKADIHLEADIHATEGNKNGFGAGEWIPYLTIAYTLVNTDTGDKQEGTFMPMVASDGPHYGANIKMMGWVTIKSLITSANRPKRVYIVTLTVKPVLVVGGNHSM